MEQEREKGGVGSNFKEELGDGDDISELRLDQDAEGGGGGGEQEARTVTVTRIKPVGEGKAGVGVGVQGEGVRQGERAQTRTGKERDYCTPEVRRRVEEWIADCEREGCKGFVKRVRGGSGENSSGCRSCGDGDGNENMNEGAVRVRGGSLAPGWREWGRGWGAYKFMS